MTQTYDQWFLEITTEARREISHDKAIILSLLHTPERARVALRRPWHRERSLFSSEELGWTAHAAHDWIHYVATFNNDRILALNLIRDALDAQTLLDEGQPEIEALQRIISGRTARVEKLFS